MRRTVAISVRRDQDVPTGRIRRESLTGTPPFELDRAYRRSLIRLLDRPSFLPFFGRLRTLPPTEPFGPEPRNPAGGSMIRAFIVSVAVLLGCAQLSIGQPHGEADTVIVSSELSCPDCEIEVERIATIGATRGEGILTGPPWIIQKDAQGGYLVVCENSMSQIRVFDSNGDFERILGGEGSGPGEFRMVKAVIPGPGDSLFVLDAGQGRITVLGPTRAPARVTPMKGNPYDGLYISDGRLFVNSIVKSRDRIGYPLHIVDGSGRFVRSFGTEHPVYRADRTRLQLRKLARSARGVWAAHRMQYVFELWSFEGQLVRRLFRETDWFEPYDTPPSPAPDRPPAPWVVDIHPSRSGRLLWSVVRVPAPDYEVALSERPSMIEGQRVYRVQDLGRLYESRIELIDPTVGKLISRKRVPDVIAAWLDSDEFATYREEGGGVPRVHIWRVRFRSSQGRRE